jgi:hypothetical protein
MAPTSRDMALSVLIPLPFDIISTVLRFWIRYKRKAWGPDDWAMLINLVSTTGIKASASTDIKSAILVGEYYSHNRHGLEWCWSVRWLFERVSIFQLFEGMFQSSLVSTRLVIEKTN